MTDIEQAALKLVRFFREKCAPEDAYESGQDDDWPVIVAADNEEDSEELASLIEGLEDKLVEAGHDVGR